jgi:hypothetical protein
MVHGPGSRKGADGYLAVIRMDTGSSGWLPATRLAQARLQALRATPPRNVAVRGQ